MRRDRLWVIVMTATLVLLVTFFLEPWARVEISFTGPGHATTTDGSSAIQAYGTTAYVLWMAALIALLVGLRDVVRRWDPYAPRWYAGLGVVQSIAVVVAALTGPRVIGLGTDVRGAAGPLLWVAALSAATTAIVGIRAITSPLHATSGFGDDRGRTQDDNRGTDA